MFTFTSTCLDIERSIISKVTTWCKKIQDFTTKKIILLKQLWIFACNCGIYAKFLYFDVETSGRPYIDSRCFDVQTDTHIHIHVSTDQGTNNPSIERKKHVHFLIYTWNSNCCSHIIHNGGYSICFFFVVPAAPPLRVCVCETDDRFELQSFLGFGQSADIDIYLDGQETRKTADVKIEDGKKEKLLLYYDGETVSGKVGTRQNKCGPLVKIACMVLGEC